MKKVLSKICLLVATSLLTVTSFANNSIVVLKSPDLKSTQITEITDKNESNFIKVFQKNDWVKVANTQNGDVGWIKLPNEKEKLKMYLKYKKEQLKDSLKNLDKDYNADKDYLTKKLAKVEAKIKDVVSKTNDEIIKDKEDRKHKKLQTKMVENVEAQSISVSIQDGKAIIIKKWLDKNGNWKSLKKEVPEADLNSYLKKLNEMKEVNHKKIMEPKKVEETTKVVEPTKVMEKTKVEEVTSKEA